MNPYVYPTGFGSAPSDAVRARADAVRSLEQPTPELKAYLRYHVQ